MTVRNADNERIKRKYLIYFKEAKRYSEQTVDASAKAIHRFEVYTKHRDFKSFNIDAAVAFKKHLAEQRNQQRRKAQQGDPIRHALTSEALFSVACVSVRLQIAS